MTDGGRRQSCAFGPMWIWCLTPATSSGSGTRKKREGCMGGREKWGRGRVCQIRVRCIVSHARCGRVWPGAVFRILVEIQVYPAYQSHSMTQASAMALSSRQDKHIDTWRRRGTRRSKETHALSVPLWLSLTLNFKCLLVFCFCFWYYIKYEGWSFVLNIVSRFVLRWFKNP